MLKGDGGYAEPQAVPETAWDRLRCAEPARPDIGPSASPGKSPKAEGRSRSKTAARPSLAQSR